MATGQLPLPGNIVKKSNRIARAKWPVSSVWEPRLVALVAARVKTDDEDLTEYEIPVSELVQRHRGGKSYEEVRRVADNIMGRVIEIPKENGRGWSKYGLFSKCSLDMDTDTLKVSFHPDLKEHYIGLKRNFTKYSLIEFLMLPSTYSQRLYEVLKSWSGAGKVKIELTELQDMLGVSGSMAKYSQFKRHVLERAHRDINRLTQLKFQWYPVKKGRKVVAVQFIFGSTVSKRIEAEQQQKQSRSNNELFKRAITCWKERGCQCNVEPTSEMCKVCRRIQGSK